MIRAWPLQTLGKSGDNRWNKPVWSNCCDCNHRASLWVEVSKQWKFDANIPPGTIIAIDPKYAKEYLQMCEPCYTLRVLGENA